MIIDIIKSQNPADHLFLECFAETETGKALIKAATTLQQVKDLQKIIAKL